MSVDQKSYLFTADGIARAETLTSLSCNVATTDGSYTSATLVGQAQVASVLITLASGRSIVLSEGEPIPVFSQGSLLSVEALAVEPGDYLSIRNSFSSAFGKVQQIPALNGEGEQELNSNIAWLAGFAMGGMFEGKTYSSLFYRQRSVLEAFLNRFRQSAGSDAEVTIDPIKPYENSADPDLAKIKGFRATWRSHREQFQALNSQGVRDAIALSPFEVKASFLAGLFDCCYRSGVFDFEFRSADADIDWLQHFLLSVGVDSSKSQTDSLIVRWYSRKRLVEVLAWADGLYSYRKPLEPLGSEETKPMHTVPVNAIASLYDATAGSPLPKFIHEWATFSQPDVQAKLEELHPDLPNLAWLKGHFLDEVVAVEEVNRGLQAPRILSVFRVENNLGLIVNGVALG